MLISIVGCATNEPVDLKEESVLELRLSTKISSINNYKYEYESDGNTYYTSVDKKVKIVLNNQKQIEEIYIVEKGVSTKKGIEVGSSMDDVINSYGSTYYERMEQGDKVIGYKDKANDIRLEFFIDDRKKVYNIRLN